MLRIIGAAETIGVPKAHNTSNKGIGIGNPKFMARDDWKLAHRKMLENTSAVQLYMSKYMMTFYFYLVMSCYI